MRDQQLGAFIARVDGQFKCEVCDLTTSWSNTLLTEAGVASKDNYQQE